MRLSKFTPRFTWPLSSRERVSQGVMFEGFIKTRAKQIRRAAAYEERDSFEMAFLSMWHVLECGLKAHFEIDIARGMPQFRKIEDEFGGCENLLRVVNPKNKWRRRRNAIAHTGDDFGRAETYREYKHEVMNAIDDLHRALAAFHRR